jgi:hypothetical protein
MERLAVEVAALVRTAPGSQQAGQTRPAAVNGPRSWAEGQGEREGEPERDRRRCVGVSACVRADGGSSC